MIATDFIRINYLLGQSRKMFLDTVPHAIGGYLIPPTPLSTCQDNDLLHYLTLFYSPLTQNIYTTTHKAAVLFVCLVYLNLDIQPVAVVKRLAANEGVGL